jgi:hypothetical protein
VFFHNVDSGIKAAYSFRMFADEGFIPR